MENKYFTELAHRLQAAGITTGHPERNQLTVLLNDQPVLFVSSESDVFLLPAGSNPPEASELYHKVAQTAEEVYAYDNSMKLEPLYNGRQFPEYLYDNSSMGLKIVPAENQAPELLWLPASEQQIRRTLLRAGWQDPDHADYTIDVFLLQKEAGRILNEKRDSLHSLNAMCGAIAKLEQKDRDKLEAVIVFAEPENAGAIRRLAENLEQFDFIPGIHTPEEYGRYMIRESGRFEYDDILEAFYDYEGYGQHRIQQENGRFSGYGYVSYPGTMALEDLMAEDPAEAYQAEQGLQMGGLE